MEWKQPRHKHIAKAICVAILDLRNGASVLIYADVVESSAHASVATKLLSRHIDASRTGWQLDRMQPAAGKNPICDCGDVCETQLLLVTRIPGLTEVHPSMYGRDEADYFSRYRLEDHRYAREQADQ